MSWMLEPEPPKYHPAFADRWKNRCWYDGRRWRWRCPVCGRQLLPYGVNHWTREPLEPLPVARALPPHPDFWVPTLILVCSQACRQQQNDEWEAHLAMTALAQS